MIKKMIFVLSFILCFALFACAAPDNGGKNGDEDDIIDENIDFIVDYTDQNLEHLKLGLTFDENSGKYVNDVKEQYGDKLINYVFNNAVYKESVDPRWIKRSAASGSSLAFDGYSNYIEYPKSEVSVSGKKLTVSVFVAPRMFEWDDPNARDLNTENLQVILGQFDKSANAGFVVGMYRGGNFSFQFGLGDRWVKVWNTWDYLDRYNWNHIVCVFDGEAGKASIYRNGLLNNTVNCGTGQIAPANKPLYIGKSNQVQRTGVFELGMFNGLMDELRIYDTALDSATVEDYNSKFLISGKLRNVIFEDAWLDESILYDDIYRPAYHIGPPQHWMNEPHALFYYNNRYHLFYQFNMKGPYWHSLSWGHWVSEDMIYWKNVREAIIPAPKTVAPDGIWSGGVAHKKNGAPVLFITAGNDLRPTGSNQNIALAEPVDLSDPDLIEWRVSKDMAVTQTNAMGLMNEFRDPNIFYEDGVYNMLVTGAKSNGQGMSHLFQTTDDSFMNWDYRGSLLDLSTYPSYLGTSWELTNLVKISNSSKTVNKYLYVISPSGTGAKAEVFYWIGEFDAAAGKFIPEQQGPQQMDYGGFVFTGPTVYSDPKTGDAYICSIMQGQRSGREEYNAGWAHTAGIPRKLMLDDNGKLMVLANDNIKNLRAGELLNLTNVNIADANNSLQEINKTLLNIKLEVTLNNSFGLDLKSGNGKYMRFDYDFTNKYAQIDTRNTGNTVTRGRFGGGVELLPENKLKLDIYIDKSMVEIFINNSKVISGMVYNLETGINLFASGGDIRIDKLQIYEFKSIYGGT